MRNYHPEADPQFVAMDSHYEQLRNAEFSQALFNAFSAVDFIALETEMRDFYFKLWEGGYKIVPLVKPSTDVAETSYVVPIAVTNTTSDEPLTYQATQPSKQPSPTRAIR